MQSCLLLLLQLQHVLLLILLILLLLLPSIFKNETTYTDYNIVGPRNVALHIDDNDMKNKKMSLHVCSIFCNIHL